MKKQAFSPYLPLDTYIPDGEPHVFGDRVYMLLMWCRGVMGDIICIMTFRGSGGRILIMTEHGKPLTEINLQDTRDWKTSGTVVFHVQGDLPLYLYYQGKGKVDLLDFTLSEGET